MEINRMENIAEICGIILGDGHLHTRYNRITIVGSLEDYDYYIHRVIPLFKILGKTPSLRRRKDRNSFYLTIQNKDLFELFTKDMGLHRGHKKSACIPDKIMNNKELIPHFLRGLFDTDGCLKFSKQNSNRHYYPRIQLQFQTSNLAAEVGILLTSQGFRYGSWKDRRGRGAIYYLISGLKTLDVWFSKIKPKNLVHTSKYKFYRKFGYYIPKSSIKERLKTLSLYTK